MDRKALGTLTIAHISDLHTPAVNSNPRNSLADFHLPLVDDFIKNKVDLLVVTGDIADNPLPKATGFLNGRANKASIQSLESALLAAKGGLVDLCSKSGIDARHGLFVIPGNHDLRMQGILTGGKDYSNSALEAFQDVFADYYRPLEIDSTYQSESRIAARIVPFNSNANQRALNFSSGAVSVDELKKFSFFSPTATESKPAPDSAFKICLVHHHPLPIGTAERPEASGDGEPLAHEFAKLVVGNAEAFDGVQTNAFRNAGIFLSYADAEGVDLILHGHQHRAWYTHLSYPFRNGQREEKRMLVAAAASIAEWSPSRFVSYNLIRLGRDGNIHVNERVFGPTTGASFQLGKHYRLYEPRDLRGSRHRKMAQLHRSLPPNPAEVTFGTAEARSVNRVCTIENLAGDALVTLTIDGLRPGIEDLEFLPFLSVQYSDVEIEKPTVEKIGSGPTVRFLRTASEGKGKEVSWRLSFEPPLQKGSEISLKIGYRLKSAVRFTREIDSDDWKDNEFVYYRCASVFPERLTSLVLFPVGWRPQEPPRVVARRKSQSEIDIEETRALSSTFVYQAEAGLAVFTTDLPMPGFSYGIEWQIPNRISS